MHSLNISKLKNNLSPWSEQSSASRDTGETTSFGRRTRSSTSTPSEAPRSRNPRTRTSSYPRSRITPQSLKSCLFQTDSSKFERFNFH